jgi:hypothetical protein
MQVRRVLLTGVLAILAAAVPVVAQEGHPLTGSWHGSWSPSSSQRTPVMIYMKYNGKEVEGIINPGPNAVPIKSVTLDASKWMVKIEADAKDGSHIVIDGKLDNIGSYNRFLSGTWTQGSNKGEFKITRD